MAENMTLSSTEEVTQPLTEDVTQPSSSEQGDEKSDPEKIEPLSDDVVAQEIGTDFVVDANDTAQSTVVNAMLPANECIVENSESQNMDEESTSGVSTSVTIQVPEKEILDSDNSEAYLTPTDPNDTEKKTSLESDAVKTESQTDPVEDEEVPQYNGVVGEKCEDDNDENASTVQCEIVDKSDSTDAQISVICDETKSQEVTEDGEVNDRVESDLLSKSQISDSNLSDSCSPIHSTEIIDNAGIAEEKLSNVATLAEPDDECQLKTTSETVTKTTSSCGQPEASTNDG